MSFDLQALISGYLDDTLSPEEHAALRDWLNETPEHTADFVRVVLLHDRLRSELRAGDTIPNLQPPPESGVSLPSLRRRSPLVAAATALLGVTIVVAVFWNQFADTSASAGIVELDRLIVANAASADRSYFIRVEAYVLSQERGRRKQGPQAGRPPKPPLDEAILHVSGGRQFVLVRNAGSGQTFVTGSNGRVSWAVRPDGPVRVSSDLTRFSRDLPGHEHDMPLISINEDLQRVRATYDIQFVPDSAPDAGATHATRTLVAVKHRKARGPERIEITYVAATGRIRELRFFDMPYGPEHLTVRLTLTSEGDLGPRFFDHESHHGPERAVEFED